MAGMEHQTYTRLKQPKTLEGREGLDLDLAKKWVAVEHARASEWRAASSSAIIYCYRPPTLSPLQQATRACGDR
jgi:hypothetical protein